MKYCWSEEVLGPQVILNLKNFWVEKFVNQKQIWGQKILDTKNVTPKKLGKIFFC